MAPEQERRVAAEAEPRKAQAEKKAQPATTMAEPMEAPITAGDILQVPVALLATVTAAYVIVISGGTADVSVDPETAHSRDQARPEGWILPDCRTDQQSRVRHTL